MNSTKNLPKRWTRIWQKLAATILLVSFVSGAQDTIRSNSVLGNIDSLAKAFSYGLAHFSPPKLIERRHLLRSHQQRGYASALLSVLDGDAFLGLLSYVRTRLQIEYSLPHDGIAVDIGAQPLTREQSQALSSLTHTKFTIKLPEVPNGPATIILDIDWSFPDDPWKKD
jgi:hypothetical protein